MKIENEEQLYEFMDVMEELYEKVAKIATLMLRLEDKKCIVGTDEITFENDSFEIACNINLGCGAYDTYYISVPGSYLFDDDFIEKAKVKVAEKKQKEAEKLKKQQEAAQQRILERERQQYLKLKEKFENENN